MNNKVLNTCYKCINRFITLDECILRLEKYDTSVLSKEDKIAFNKLLASLKKVSKDYPSKEDDYVLNNKKQIEKSIEALYTILDNLPDGDTSKIGIKKQIKSLEKSLKNFDSNERWYNAAKCIMENNYYCDLLGSLTKYKLFKFITRYIAVPTPPIFDQKLFDELVDIGIKKDEREGLWRLAFNYQRRKMNFDKIIDYFLQVNDEYYITELLHAVPECLNLNKVLNKIENPKVIHYILDHEDYITDKQRKMLREKIKSMV